MFLLCFSSFLTFDVVNCEHLQSNFVSFRFFQILSFCKPVTTNKHMQTSESDYFVLKSAFFLMKKAATKELILFINCVYIVEYIMQDLE